VNPQKEGGQQYLPVGGRTLFTKRKMAFSGLSFMCFLISYTNLPTVMSAGTRNLESYKKSQHGPRRDHQLMSDYDEYFFLSMSGASLLGAFSTITGMRSGYLALMRSATSRLLSAIVQKGTYP